MLEQVLAEQFHCLVFKKQQKQTQRRTDKGNPNK